MTISKLTKWLGAAVLAGYLGTLITSNFALNKLEVGGPIFDKIVLEKDLVADILPPPAYLIESYLEASLALAAQLNLAGTPEEAQAEIALHAKALKKLQEDYEARHEFWRQQDLTPELMATFLKASYEPGERFWRTLNDKFMPALTKGDSAEAQRYYNDLSVQYREHRKAIDQTVELANQENDAILADAAQQKLVALSVMWGVGLLGLLLVAGALVGVLVAILKPMNRLNRVMSELGDRPKQHRDPLCQQA